MKKHITFIPYILFFCTIAQAQTWSTISTDNSGLCDNDVRAIHIDSSGTMWLGTASGLCSYDGENWTTFTTNNTDLTSDAVTSLMSDQSESDLTLWIGTEGGVFQAQIQSPQDISILNSFQSGNSTLLADQISAVNVDPWDIAWFGTENGANTFNGDTLARYSRENWWIDHNNIKAIEVAPDGMVYLGTEGKGISRLKTDLGSIDGVTSASTIDWGWSGADEIGGDKLASDSIYAIYIRSDGVQWYGTDQGVSLHTSDDTRRDWKTFKVADGIADNFVQAIAEDTYGNIWIGTKNGVSFYNGVRWLSYTKADGLVDNFVQSLVVDDQGAVWFGTRNGLSKLVGVTSVKSEATYQAELTTRVRNHPNPFRGRTTIQFYLHEQSKIKVTIHDLRGRVVNTLFAGELPKGMNSLVWRGENSIGLQQASGAYVVRIAYNGKSETRLIYLIK